MAFGAVKPVSQPRKLFNISGYDTSSNQQAIAVPYAAGDVKIALTWISPIYNQTIKTVDSGSGGKASSKAGAGGSGQKKYRGDICGAVCYCVNDAPVDQLIYVLVNDEVAYHGPLARTPGQHYAAFSMQKYCQDCRVWWGTKDSPFDDHILMTRGALASGIDPRDKSTWPIDASSGGTVIDGKWVAGVTDPQSGHYDVHPAYRNVCRLTFRQFHFGSSPNFPNIAVIIRRGCAWLADSSGNQQHIAGLGAGVNPATPIYEIFTDDLAGAGMPVARIDRNGLINTYNQCHDNGVALAPLVTQASSLRSFFADYLSYYNGWLRSKNNTLECGVFLSGNFNQAGIPVFGDDDLTEEPNIKPGTDDDTSNYFALVFTNSAHWFNSDDVPARYVDQDNFLRVGERRPEWVQRPYFINETVGIRYITQYGIVKAQPPHSGTVMFKRERVAAIRPADLIKLNSAGYEQTLLLRVLQKQLPGDRDGSVQLTVQREPGTWPALYDPDGIPKVGDFLLGAAPIDYFKIIELPYDLRSDFTSIELIILALRPNPISLGFNVHLSDDNVDFEPLVTGEHFAVLGRTTQAYNGPTLDTTAGINVELFGYDLDSVVSQTDSQRDNDTLLLFWADGGITSIGQVVPTGSGGFKIYGRNARFGTSVGAHASNSDVWICAQRNLVRLSHSYFYPGNEVFFKLQDFTELADFDLALAAAIPYTILSPFGPEPVALTPGSTSFVAGAFLRVDLANLFDGGLPRTSYLPGNLIVRFTGDGTPVTNKSQVWPQAGGLYTFGGVTQTTTVRVRGFNSRGQPGPETFYHYTAVASGSQSLPTCGLVTFDFTGVRGRTAGNLTLVCATQGATIHYSINGGAFATYSAPFHIALGDNIVAYATKTGFLQSPNAYFNNDYAGVGSGGSPGGGGRVAGLLYEI